MRFERTITVVGCQVGGEENNVITGGVLPPPGDTVFAQKRWLETEGDWLRRWLLLEPRGKPTSCVNLVVPARDPRADAGFIIMESTDYPPMSGSNTICTTTVLLETGMLPMCEPQTRLTLESPAGLVSVVATCRDGKVTAVRFTNVPAFATHLGVAVEVPGLGTVSVDVAYGGAFFALVDAATLGFALEPSEARELVEVGQRIKAAAAEQIPVVHPENPDIHTITFTEFTGPFAGPGRDSANAVVVSPGRIDRSPCGTGTSARLAVLHARGALAVGEGFTHTSLIGSRFEAAIVDRCEVGPHRAVSTTIAGQAWVTGIFQHGYDPSDPFRDGYTLSDLWLESSVGGPRSG
ncbi:MAG: proline racemase family protein [Ectothiorhodospiraceae bacterium]|nr:proline racemase family protein [Ectothiorhodospiraceae bacterium]